MSADNGYVIRENSEGEYVLQMYSGSADDFPPIDAQGAIRCRSLEEAVLVYAQMEKDDYFISEYGLTFRLGRPSQGLD